MNPHEITLEDLTITGPEETGTGALLFTAEMDEFQATVQVRKEAWEDIPDFIREKVNQDLLRKIQRVVEGAGR